jgi:hypothetical protein
VGCDAASASAVDACDAELHARPVTRRLNFAAKQSPDAATLLAAGLYEPLLEWAESYALHVHGTRAPWANATPAAPAPSQDVQMDEPPPPPPPPDAAAEARRRGKRPRAPTAAEIVASARQCTECDLD